MVESKVDNMHCGGCARAVTAALRGADPGAEVSVDLDRRVVAVATARDVEDLAAALREGGFSGQALSA